MSEYCNNRLSERFKNKIPQFLTHLSVWNEDTMHDCAATPRAYHKALKKQQKKTRRMRDMWQSIREREISENTHHMQ